MPQRLRILAGPNGSGKTSVYRELRDRYHWGIFVNADELERLLQETGSVDLREYAIPVLNKEAFLAAYVQYFQSLSTSCDINNLSIEEARVSVLDTTKIDSYFAAFLATFIRERLLEMGISFSFETVMSHPNKVAFIEKARQCGYRVYLYFVSTQSVEINIGRVHTRVLEGGHDVPEDKVRKRYVLSMANLYGAVKQTNRAYIFDNSGKKCELLAEYDAEDNSLEVHHVTQWLQDYLLNKAEQH